MTAKPVSAAAHTPSPECRVANEPGPVHVRDVLAGEQFFQQWHDLIGSVAWPSAQDVARAAAFLARDRAERQGRLL